MALVTQPLLYIVFTDGQPALPTPWYRFLRWTIATLTRSDLIHVAVGFDDVILNPRVPGYIYHAFDAFIADYPGILKIIEVPMIHPINLGYFERYVDVPIPALPTFIRWLRRGQGLWTSDCVCVALACLRAGGVMAPADIVSPAQLDRWLSNLEGTRCHSMTKASGFSRS